MKFPETLPYECPVEGCPVVLDLPASAQIAPSEDPRYVGFMVIVEKQAALDHVAEHAAAASPGGDLEAQETGTEPTLD